MVLPLPSTLANKYGDEVLSEITNNLRRWGTWRVEEAIELATGVRGERGL